MYIWLVTIGEPVPTTVTSENRLHRTGTLAHYLSGLGHRVVWWTSAFDHSSKKHIANEHSSIRLKPGLEINLIRGCGYQRNISLSRIRDHKQVAKVFAEWSKRAPTPPDIIIAAFPDIGLAAECVKYARLHSVPVLLDIRDLWPDIFAGVVPKILKTFVKLAVHGMNNAAIRALQGATGIIGISDGYLDWALRKAKLERRVTDIVLPLGYTRRIIRQDDIVKAEIDLRTAGVSPDKFICWFVGVFGKTYDLRPVIEAAKRMWASGDESVQFVLSGTGDQENLWRRLAKGLPNVVFTGWVNAARIEWLGRVSKIGLAAYVENAPQGLPNKVFEYLAFGLPVVSSLKGETAVLLESERCGYSYAAENSDSLLEILLHLKAHEGERIAAGTRAKALFDREYSTDVIYPKLLNHLEMLARNG